MQKDCKAHQSYVVAVAGTKTAGFCAYKGDTLQQVLYIGNRTPWNLKISAGSRVTAGLLGSSLEFVADIFSAESANDLMGYNGTIKHDKLLSTKGNYLTICLLSLTSQFSITEIAPS